MRLGATLAHLSPAPPFAIAERAKRLVDGGFDSLRVPQVFGRGFWVADPFVTPAVAATATEGVEPGTATLQVPLHHPAEQLSGRDRRRAPAVPGGGRATGDGVRRPGAGQRTWRPPANCCTGSPRAASTMRWC